MGEIVMYEFINNRVRDVMTSDPLKINQYATYPEIESIFEATKLYERLQTKIGGEREWCE